MRPVGASLVDLMDAPLRRLRRLGVSCLCRPTVGAGGRNSAHTLTGLAPQRPAIVKALRRGLKGDQEEAGSPSMAVNHHPRDSAGFQSLPIEAPLPAEFVNGCQPLQALGAAHEVVGSSVTGLMTQNVFCSPPGWRGWPRRSCAQTETRELISDGATTTLEDWPINTDGGCLANGEPIGACGVRQVHVNVLRFRGDVRPHQVPGDPDVASLSPTSAMSLG